MAAPSWESPVRWTVPGKVHPPEFDRGEDVQREPTWTPKAYRTSSKPRAQSAMAAQRPSATSSDAFQLSCLLTATTATTAPQSRASRVAVGVEHAQIMSCWGISLVCRCPFSWRRRVGV